MYKRIWVHLCCWQWQESPSGTSTPTTPNPSTQQTPHMLGSHLNTRHSQEPPTTPIMIDEQPPDYDVAAEINNDTSVWNISNEEETTSMKNYLWPSDVKFLKSSMDLMVILITSCAIIQHRSNWGQFDLTANI